MCVCVFNAQSDSIRGVVGGDMADPVLGQIVQTVDETQFNRTWPV